MNDMIADLDIEDPKMLDRYLRATGRIEQDEEIAIRILNGGISNRTVLVQRATGEAWVVKQALEKLRVSVDWFSRPERIEREALGMRWLASLVSSQSTTRLIFEDPKHHLLAMEAIPEPHAVWKDLLLVGQLEQQHFVAFGHLLGTIHRESYRRRRELSKAFADRSFFESLRIEPYYAYTAAHVLDAATFFAELISDIRARRITLVHGDYSPKNILIHNGRLILLDHEVIHFGDPAFDVGFALAHLLSKANHIAEKRETFAQVTIQYWNAYASVLTDLPWQEGFQARCVCHAVGCLLARVAGKSPLEYLSNSARTTQLSAAISLMRRSPGTICELVARYFELLELETQP
jgi:5-methylthioribose kinase